MKNLGAIILLAVLSAGCANVSPPEPTRPSATAFPSATRFATATALASATAFQSFTPLPPPTNAPTLAPIQTARPTDTRTPTPTAVPSPTPAIAASELIVCTLLVAPGQPGPLYAILADSYCFTSRTQTKFLVSNDFGKSWVAFPGGLPVGSSCLRNINLDYIAIDALYASTCQGLYRWSQSKWNLISSQQTESVAIVYGQPNMLAAIARTDQGGPVIRSTDSGKTWNNASTGLVHFNGVANLARDPRSSNLMYAIIWPKYAGSYLRRGTTSGDWDTMPTPLNNTQIEIGMTIDGATGALYVTAYNFAQSGNTSSPRMQIWRATDPSRPDVKAVTWDQIYDFGENVIVNLLASGWSPQGLALYARVMPTNCSSVTDPKCIASVQRSLDGGKSWAQLVIK